MKTSLRQVALTAIFTTVAWLTGFGIISAQVESKNLPKHAVRILGDARYAVKFSKLHFIDNERVAAFGRDWVVLIDVKSGATTRIPDPVANAGETFVHQSICSHWLVTIIRGGKQKRKRIVCITDLLNLDDVKRLELNSHVDDVSADGSHILVRVSKSMELIRTSDGTVVSTLPVADRQSIQSARFVRDETAIAISAMQFSENPTGVHQFIEFNNVEWKFGDPISQFSTGPDEPFSLMTMKSGNVVAVCGLQGTLGVHNFVEEQSAQLAKSTTSYMSAQISPTNDRLLAASNIAQIALWDLQTMKPIFQVGTFRNASNICFSPDGTLIAANIGGNVRFWDVENGGQKYGIDEKALSSFASLTVSADGEKLAVADRNGHVEVWNTKDGIRVPMSFSPIDRERLVDSQPNASTFLRFSNDGAFLLGGSDMSGNQFNLWDSKSGKLTQQIDGHIQPVTGIAWSPDNKTVASLDRIGKLRVLDQAGSVLLNLRTELKEGRPLFIDDQNLVGGNHVGVHVINMATGDVAGTFADSENEDGMLLGIDVATSNGRVAGIYANGEVVAWDSKSGNVVFRRTTKDVDFSTRGDVAFSSDGKTLAACFGSDEIWIVDSETGEEKLKLEATANVASLCFSEKHLFSAGSDHRVIVWTLPK